MDEDTRQSFIVTMAEIQEQEPFETPAPDFLRLLDAIAVSCPVRSIQGPRFAQCAERMRPVSRAAVGQAQVLAAI